MGNLMHMGCCIMLCSTGYIHRGVRGQCTNAKLKTTDCHKALFWLLYLTVLISTGISDEDIANLTLPTGVPVLLELDENLKPVKPRQLLGDQTLIQAAIKKVEDQGRVRPST